MGKYELTIIIDPDLDEDKRKKILEKLKEWIKKEKGEVKKFDEWGKRQLAYQIAKKNEGFYYLFDLELTPQAAKKLPQNLNLEESILRYLLIKRE